MGIATLPQFCICEMFDVHLHRTVKARGGLRLSHYALQHSGLSWLVLCDHVQGAYQSPEGVIKVLDGKADVWVAHAGLLFLGALPLNVHLRYMATGSDCDLIPTTAPR